MSYRTYECGQDFGKFGGMFQIGNKKFKKYCKIFKRIIRALKVSMKKNSKNSKKIENFMKRFKMIRLRVSTVRERSI